MKKYLQSIVLLTLFQLWFSTLQAQTPWDEVMMGKGEICTALIYEHSSWDQYWEGSYLRENANIGTFTRQMGMPMVAIGLTKKINIIASLPYINTKASGGTQAGQSGFQDLSVSVKVDWLQKQLGSGRLLFLTNAHVSTPVGNYLSDYMPFSLGAGAPELGFRGIGGYKMDNGLVFRASLAYLWRGQTEVERDYYYEKGSVYSSFMNVPNALNFHGAIGYWAFDNRLRMEATYMNLNCLTGDDIRSYNRPQPTNKTEVSQVGAWVQYFIKSDQGFGALAYFNQTLSGRNMGKATTIGAGITYQFKAY
ncbi:transporter [Aquiflexum sp. TKW24L]|uniref:transporter n=1 Tax=Aquiflexum sp. TKW24L TaxID=2942212 RepID=UPI0020C08221|nr:transporter [Aquiflexum sp. TKW24L]MCL6258635.1 transporter [Aquiflexum sp. TKW24L]